MTGREGEAGIGRPSASGGVRGAASSEPNEMAVGDYLLDVEPQLSTKLPRATNTSSARARRRLLRLRRCRPVGPLMIGPPGRGVVYLDAKKPIATYGHRTSHQAPHINSSSPDRPVPHTGVWFSSVFGKSTRASCAHAPPHPPGLCLTPSALAPNHPRPQPGAMAPVPPCQCDLTVAGQWHCPIPAQSAGLPTRSQLTA